MKLRMYLKEMRGLMKISSVYGVALFASAVSLLSVGCNGSEDFQSGSSLSSNDVSGIVFTSGDSSFQTRTSISHTLGGGAKAVWSTGDKIWVKDNSGVFQQSGVGSFSSGMTRGSFSFSSGSFSNGCLVNYTGSNSSSGTAVTIASTQSQSVPNNFDHAGASGDCGTAVASGNGTAFTFKLDHKASYLCFLPRCMNADLGANIRLTKIVVTANVPIAGTYDFTDGTLIGKTPTNGSDSIVLKTGDFLLDNKVSDINKNGAYMVIAPGTYNFIIKYTIKDPISNVEGDIFKVINNFNCNEGRIHDITAWLDKDLEDVSGTYYTWDAAVGQHYWKGYERDASGKFFSAFVNTQPADTTFVAMNYPSTSTDSRWFNTAYGYGVSTPASRTHTNQPNVNLMCHYVEFGDPRWDANRMWTAYGHLYKGGIWLKRRTASGFPNKSTDYWGVDYRTSTIKDVDSRADILYNNTTVPTIMEQNTTYFFLPASGYFLDGKMISVGFGGHYWSSSASASIEDAAWYIYFSRTELHVRQFYRRIGSRIATFY